MEWTPMKTCNKCGECKPLDAFAKNKAKRDGLSAWCRVCNSEYNKSYCKQNAEELSDKHRVRYADKRETRLIQNQEWYRSNDAHAREKRQQWRNENRELSREITRNWAANNYSKVLANAAARRADKLRATPPWADMAAIGAIYAKAVEMRAQGFDVHVDHHYPLRGATVSGLHVHWNLRIIPAQQNLRKRNKHPDQV